MIKIEKFNGAKTYMFPNGAIANPDKIREDFPAVDVFPHIIETDEAGQVCFSVQNLAAMRSFNNIDPELSDDEAIAIMEEIRNKPPEEPGISTEERMASALEFTAMMSLNDITNNEDTIPDPMERIAASLEYLAMINS